MFKLLFRSTKEFIDCEIIAIPGRYDFKPLAFGYQLNSPYAGVLDYHIKLIRENGALDQIVTKYQRGRQVCPDLRCRIGRSIPLTTMYTLILFFQREATNCWQLFLCFPSPCVRNSDGNDDFMS